MEDFLETAAKRTFIVTIQPRLWSRAGFQGSSLVVKAYSIDKARLEAFRRIKQKKFKHLSINSVLFKVEEVKDE